MELEQAPSPACPEPVAREGTSTISLIGTPGQGQIAFDRECNVTVSATLRAIEHDSDARPTLDLLPVLDRSGSMSGRKIELLKEAMEFVIKELRDTDKLGVVSFGTDVKIEAPVSSMDAAGRQRAESATQHITCGQMTNLSGGLLRGIEELRQHSRPNDPSKPHVRAVMLLTDGMMNQGITEPDALLSVVKSAIDAIPGGASLFAFGLGSQSDADTLRKVTDALGGSFYALEDADSLATAFGDCLGGLLSVVAQNVVLRVEAQGGARLERVVTKFQSRVVEEGRVVDVVLPDLYSAEAKDVLVQLKLPKLGATVDTADAPIVKFGVRYADAVKGTIASAEECVCVSRPTAEAVAADPRINVSVAVQLNRVCAADALDAAKKAADARNFVEARAIVDKALAAIRDSFPGADKDPSCAALVADLERTKVSLSDQGRWMQWGRHEASNAAQEHYYQRCSKADMTSASRSAYRNKSKAVMMEKMMMKRAAKSAMAPTPQPGAPPQPRKQGVGLTFGRVFGNSSS